MSTPESNESVFANSIIRTDHNKEKPYALISKAILRDKRLSAKAMGLLCYILSLPSDWKIYIKELPSHFSDGEDSIRSGLKELQKFGYLTINRIRDERGRVIGTEILVYEECLLPGVSIFPTPEKPAPQGFRPYRENPDMGNPDVGNPPLLSTDKQITDLTKQQQTRARKEPEPPPTAAKAFVAAVVSGEKEKGHGEFTYTSESDELLQDLAKIDISNQRATMLIAKYGTIRVRECLELAKAKARVNPAAYFERALIEGWKPSTGKGIQEAPKDETKAKQIALEEQKHRSEWEARDRIRKANLDNPVALKSHLLGLRSALKKGRASATTAH